MKKTLTLFCFLASLQIGFTQSLDIDKTLPIIANEKNDSIRVRILWECLGTSETDPVLDMRIAEKLLIQSRKIKDPIEEVVSLACLGYDYRAFGDNTKSLKYSLQAFAVAEQNSNEAARALANMVLAYNYADLGNFEQALKLGRAAVEYISTAKFEKILVVCLMGMGEFYLNMNKIDSALFYTQRGYEICTRISYKDYLGALLQQLGTIHARLGNSTLAISYYDLAVKEGYEMGSPKFISSSYTAKAEYYNQAKQRDSAMLYARKAISVVQQTAFSNMSIYPAKLLLDIYRNTNIDSAFKYSEIYRIANDSLFNAKTVQQTQLLAFEESIRQQQLVEEKAKADEQRKQNIQYAIIALGIVTLVIFYLLLSRSFITNSKAIEFFGVIALLIVFEFLNLLLHPFLERTTNHSPVLMLMALVGIAALLVPFHHRIEKWATGKLVEKNKQLRLAAAKRTIEKLEHT